MKNYIAIIFSILILNQIFAQEYYSDVILFKVKNEYRNQCSDNTFNESSFQFFIENNNISNIERLFKTIPINHKLKLKSDISLNYKAHFNGNDIHGAIKNLNKLNCIEYAEVEYKNFVLDTTNDPFADSVTGAQPGLKMHKVYEAWDITKADSNILIAISDAGITLNHPDLVNSIYKNTSDPIDGIDNDNDGLIDNYLGWDFSENDNDPTEMAGYHGTAVSGVAGATNNNNIGVASIGYHSRIVPFKCSPDNSPNGINKGYESLLFSAQKGYDIINLSWGCPNCYSQTYQDLVNYAVLDNNLVVTAAAGNNEAELAFYPASYDNVLSVSSINTNYEKPNLRSWHYYVDLVTQGAVVKSTNENGGYGNAWGTSFSAPMVASAASLVKDIFPSYDAVQIMEQLRVTTDSIYHFPGNTNYIDKLGTGSMNVFNAVTNTTTSSIRNIKNYENTNFFYVSGDTVYLDGIFVNYLNPTTNLNITLSSPSQYIQMVDSSINLGVINTYDTVTNSLNKFSFIISDSTPILEKIWLKFSYEDLNYKDFQYKSITLNPDFININENQISTSVNSTGNIGFTAPNRNYGNGLIYNSSQVLYESGLMISCMLNDSTKVSDNIRSDPSLINEDFYFTERIKEIDNLGFSDFKASATFRDTLVDSLNNVGVNVKVNYYAWNNLPDDKYIIAEYEITNRNNDTLRNVYSGIYADWDILNFFANEAQWDFEGGFGYANSTDDSVYVGIKPLWPYYGTYYAMDNAGANGIGVYDEFTDLEKHQTLSLVNEKIKAGSPPSDISHTVGMNLGDLAPGQTKITAFAIMVGDSLEDLRNSSIAAQNKYGNQVVFTNPFPVAFDTITCENTFTQIRVDGGEEYLLYGGENDFLVLDDSLPLTTQTVSDTTVYYVAFPNGDFPGIKTPVTVYTYLPEVSFWLEPDTMYFDDRNYMYPHNTSPVYDKFEWSFGNGFFSTSENPSANYSDTGTYYVTLYLTDSNDCFNYLSLPLVILPGSEPDNLTESTQLKVFPNPTSESILISNLDESKNVIQLFDLNGKTIFNYTTNQKTSILDLSKIAKGQYLLKINKREPYKIIKN